MPLFESYDRRINQINAVCEKYGIKDLKYAKIYISVFAGDEEKKVAIEALKGSSGFIRRALGQKMIIRSLPELTFVLDESLEYGAYMNKKIDELNKKQ